MPTYGPFAPGTCADDATVGTIAWGNVNNAKASDNAWATALLGALEVSHYLKCTNFGFAIPGNETVVGIVLGVERQRRSLGGGSIFDNSIKLVIADAITGDEKKNFTTWPTSDTEITYGGVTDLWGTAPTTAQANASDFGVVVSCWETSGAPTPTATGRIDLVRLTLYTVQSDVVYSRRRNRRGRRPRIT